MKEGKIVGDQSIRTSIRQTIGRIRLCKEAGLPITATSAECCQFLKERDYNPKMRKFLGLPDTATQEDIDEALRKLGDKNLRGYLNLPDTATRQDITDELDRRRALNPDFIYEICGRVSREEYEEGNESTY